MISRTFGTGERHPSIVSVIRTSEIRYESIDFQEMVEAVLGELEHEGVSLPSKGTVFIKPNLLLSASATTGITTEPRLVAALVRNLLSRGVEHVFVGDSSAGFANIADALDSTGMRKMVEEAGGKVVDVDVAEERIDLPLAGSDILTQISVPKKVVEADFLINFSKLKTHRFGAMTGAVKNWVGLIEKNTRLRHHQNQLPKLVAELHKLLPEDLCLTDALIIGEGDGPDLCSPRLLGVLLASNDPVASDSVASELLSIDRNELIFPWTAYLDGIGEIHRNLIRVVGCDAREIAIHVERPIEVLYNRFPCNIVMGGMCPGCFVWFIGPALFWEKEGLWDKISTAKGRPTFMFGFNANDINFERHCSEGPYFVIGDCPPERYRNDPRTIHIPGCTPGPKISDKVLAHLGLAMPIWGESNE
jgi:uncharacterized protein (DUF362 family)